MENAGIDGKFQFKIGDDILCYCGKILHRAKCLDRCLLDNIPHYLVHYKGQTNDWDEWLKEDLVLIENHINTMHMKRTRQLLSAKKKIKNCSQIHNKNSNKTVFKIKKCRVLLNKVSVSHQAEHPLEHTVTSNSCSDIIPCESESKRPSNDLLTTNIICKQKTCNLTVDDIIKTCKQDLLVVNNIKHKIKNSMFFLKVPGVLKVLVELDNVMNKKYNRAMQFPEEYNVADVIFEYIETKANGLQRETALTFGLFCLKYFNLEIHKTYFYENEKKYGLPLKALDYFTTNIVHKKNLVLHEELNPKKYWCYVYDPIYLLRIFVDLHKMRIAMGKDRIVDNESIEDFLRFFGEHWETFISKVFKNRTE